MESIIKYASGVEDVLTFDPTVDGSEDWQTVLVEVDTEKSGRMTRLVVPQGGAVLGVQDTEDLIAALQGALVLLRGF